MSIADKLAIIAENQQKVYEAGMAAAGNSTPSNISIQTIDFGDAWFKNVSQDNGYKTFTHNLANKPSFVAICANQDLTNVDDLENDTIVCATKFADTAGTYVRKISSDGTYVSATRAAPYGIFEITEEAIKVNALSSAYLWPPNTITTYTMLCIV